MRRKLAMWLSAVALLTVGCTNQQTAVADSPAAPTPTVVTVTAGSATPTKTTTTTDAVPTTTAKCQQWDIGLENVDQPKMLTDLYHVVIDASNPCYDEVQFWINGKPAPGKMAGSRVGWVSQLLTDPKGDRIDVGSGAILQVAVFAPAQGYGNSGSQPGTHLAVPGDHMNNVGQGTVVRGIWFAGSSENQADFGLLTDHQRQHRTVSWVSGDYTYVAVRVAKG